MEFVNPISFPFVKWFAASIRRVNVLKLILIVASLCSFGDVWLEQRDGTASVRFGRNLSQSSASRAEKPDEFGSIIRWEIVRSLGLLVLAAILQGAASAVSRHDIFAPGQKFKSLDDE